MRKKRGLEECPYCLLDLTSFEKGSNRSNHVRWCQKNPNHERFIKEAAERKKIPRSEESIQKSREGVKKAWQDGKYDNVDFKTISIENGYKHSQEVRAIMSEKKKKWCLDNKDKHNWSLRHRKSVPCEFLKNKLIEKGIFFVEEYMPLQDRLYQIDIAFPDIKIGIEINGNQHYDNQILKPYYQERHDLIESTGWKIYEFHYWEAFGTKIIDFILDKII